MKKLFILTLLLLFLSLMMVPSLSSATYDDTDITLTSSFDDENLDIVTNINNQGYGSKLSLDTLDYEGYDFAFWIVNGIVRKDLPFEHQFVVVSQMEIVAVFSPLDAHAVIFMDANGALLDIQYVSDGDDAIDLTEGLPDKPGMVITPSKWDGFYQNITQDTVLVLQYEADEPAMYTLSVLNGTGSGDYLYNEKATVFADTAPSNMVFSHWESNGVRVSYLETFTFTMLGHLTIEAIYHEVGELSPPLVHLSEELDLRVGYRSFKGQFFIPEGFELIEYGMITSLEEGWLTLEDNVNRFIGTKRTSDNEYLMSFNEVNHENVRAYLIVRNSQSELMTFYSQQKMTDSYLEDFEDTPLTASYSDNSFYGVNDQYFEYGHARDDGGYSIDGVGIMLRRASDSFLKTTFTDGLDHLSFEYRKAFTGTTDRQIEVIITDEFDQLLIRFETEVFGFGSGEETDVYIFDSGHLGLKGEVNVLIKNVGTNDTNRQFVIDNFSFTSYHIPANEHILHLSASVDTKPSVDVSGPYYQTDTTLSVSTEIIVDDTYLFSYWIDPITSQILSYDETMVFNIDRHRHIKAVYVLLEDHLHTIELSSNIEGTNTSIVQDEPYHTNKAISIEADSVPGYQFEHWKDVDAGHLLSKDTLYTFTLLINRRIEAVYLPDTEADLYVFSNVDIFDYTLSAPNPYLLNESVTVTADTIDNHQFLHWYDVLGDTILGTDKALTLTMDQSYYIIAVYEVLQSPTVVYQTGFEDATKGSYAADTLTSNGTEWMLSNALIGSLENDLKVGGRSARLSNGNDLSGYMKPLETYTGLLSVEFLAGRFGSDTSVFIDVEISSDGMSWITVTDNIALASELNAYHIFIDYEDSELINAGITKDTPLYFRILNSSATAVSASRRANVDDVRVHAYTYETPEMPEVFMSESSVYFPNNSERVSITFDESFSLYYSYGDTWTGDGCIAVDIYLGDLDCFIYGSLDSNTLGEQEIIYYVLDEDGYYASETVTKVVFRDASWLEYSYEGTYYEGLEGLYGDDLLLALRDIIQSGVTLQNYGAARDILEIADRDPENPNNVLLIYDRQSVTGLWDAETWHREHVWPNSRLGIPRVDNASINIGTDLHNLRAIDPGVNSSRGNKFFDFDTTSDTWYPGEDRGDVARIYFYMMVMWEYLVLRDELAGLDDPTFEVDGAIHGVLSTLLYFHFDDPVDGFEINRNNVIYSYQNNRNPFIDHPHLVELIYYNHTALPVD